MRNSSSGGLASGLGASARAGESTSQTVAAAASAPVAAANEIALLRLRGICYSGVSYMMHQRHPRFHQQNGRNLCNSRELA
jgi:hypothetical protein